MPDRPLTGPFFVGRRTAVAGTLGGLAATVLAAGCDHGDDIGETAPSPTASATTASPSAPEQTPDEVLVEGVNEQLTTALAVLAQARKAPGLAKPLAPLIRAHRRHVAVLEGDPGYESPPGPRPNAATALHLVRRSEQRLKAALVDAAGRAESGALAKLLASMSASVSQFLLALPAQGAPS